ncbi:MAG: hypothetical protein U0Q12_19735 [Vicinamibacterales bacterium]
MSGRTRPAACLDEVERVLRGYAERGVLQGLESRAVPGGGRRFTFRYHWSRVVTADVSARSRTIRLRRLLPNVPASSPLADAVQEFTARLADDDRPPHRRLDPRTVVGTLEREARHVSWAFRLGIDGEAATKAVVLALHELSVWLEANHPDYVWTEFAAARE